MVFECKYRDWFCFICGRYTLQRNRKNLSENFDEAYRLYFGKEIELLKMKPHTPKIVCTTCYVPLMNWYNDKGNLHLSFSSPMIWNEVVEHEEGYCYFCANYAFGHSSRTLNLMKYTSVPSVEMPILLQSLNEVPPSPKTDSPPTMIPSLPGPSTASGSEYLPPDEINRPVLMSQRYFNDLVRDLNLSQDKGELLGSRLKNLRLLEPEVRITEQRTRSKDL